MDQDKPYLYLVPEIPELAGDNESVPQAAHMAARLTLAENIEIEQASEPLTPEALLELLEFTLFALQPPEESPEYSKHQEDLGYMRETLREAQEHYTGTNRPELYYDLVAYSLTEVRLPSESPAPSTIKSLARNAELFLANTRTHQRQI